MLFFLISGVYANCGVSVDIPSLFPNPINGQVLLWANELTEGVTDPSFLMIQDNSFLWANSGHDFVDSHLIKRPRLKQLILEVEAKLQNTLPSSELMQAKLIYRWYKGQKISHLIKCPPENKCIITSFWKEQLGWFTSLSMHQTNRTGRLEKSKHSNPLKHQFHIYGGMSGHVYFYKLLLNTFAMYNITNAADGCSLSTTRILESPFYSTTSAQPNGTIGFVPQ